MALDPSYVIASGLQEQLVDVNTGLPLSGGIVTFYKDQARTIKKYIYELTGGPSGYSYSPMINPFTLSAAGTFQDAFGNEFIPYYLPYDADGNIELYYIVITDAAGASEWTLQAYPNIFPISEKESVGLDNLIPNGQFLIHEITPVVGTKALGTITQDITPIAQGGWSYERSTGSTATDIITFPAFGTSVSNPTGNPKYNLKFACTTPNPTDVFKYVGITFTDVNKFSSLNATPQYYTFQFSGKTNGAPVTVGVVLDRFFGIGGATEEFPTLDSFVLTSSYQNFQVPFTYDNSGKTITTGDTVSLFISIPATYAVDISLTDFVLVIGEDVNIPVFPLEPDYIFQNQSMVPAIPDYAGNDLYLPLVLTKTGLAYDHSVVGQIAPCAYPTVVGRPGWLLCDGTTYFNQDYSTDGIPYQRLGSVIWNSTANLPSYGTGPNFVAASLRTPTTGFSVSRNTAGTSTTMVDGSVATTFTFSQVSSGATNPGFYSGIYNSGTDCYALCQVYGACTAPTAGNTGWVVTQQRPGSSITQSLFTLNVSTTASLQNKYITFYNTTTSFYIWLTVDGAAGTDPHPAGITNGIKLGILSTYTAADICQLVAQTISGFAIDICNVTKAASALTANSWFSLYNQANSQFVYYYTITGTAAVVPVVPGARITPIALAGTETAIQIANLTMIAINQTAWATPDLRGDSLRIWANGGGVELTAINRFSWLNGPYGDNIGSWEIDDLLSHIHTGSISPIIYQKQDSIPKGATTTWDDTADFQEQNYPHKLVINNTGGSETRPMNTSVNAVIKY